jgi:hypothetical protein
VARMGEDRGVHRVLVGKPEGIKPLGRPRRRWEDTIKMELAQDRDRWRALVRAWPACPSNKSIIKNERGALEVSRRCLAEEERVRYPVNSSGICEG